MANSAMEPESSLSSPSFVNPSHDHSHGVPKDWKFWCIIVSLVLSILLTAIEFASLHFFFIEFLSGKVVEQNIQIHRLVDFHRRGAPTHSLKGDQFIWVSSAYALDSSALVPLCGRLSQLFFLFCALRGLT